MKKKYTIIPLFLVLFSLLFACSLIILPTPEVTLVPDEKEGRITLVGGITFDDPGLEAAVRAAINKSEGAIFKKDVQNITKLQASGKQIKSLKGIEYLTSLTDLDLSNNLITDINPLASLTDLTVLIIHDNSITDVTPLASLTNMMFLYLSDNKITDISPLASCRWLEELYVDYNKVSDISALSGMTELNILMLGRNNISDITPLVENINFAGNDSVDLSGNPLSMDAVKLQVPALKARGVTVKGAP